MASFWTTLAYRSDWLIDIYCECECSHISEHLQELKEAINVSAMTNEELEFHYFKCVRTILTMSRPIIDTIHMYRGGGGYFYFSVHASASDS